jgi:hypothetical protein
MFLPWRHRCCLKTDSLLSRHLAAEPSNRLLVSLSHCILSKFLSNQMISGQLSFWANVPLGNYLSGQMSFWANVFWANVFLGKCLSGQMSFWANVFLGKCRLGNVILGKRRMGKYLWANVVWANVMEPKLHILLYPKLKAWKPGALGRCQ